MGVCCVLARSQPGRTVCRQDFVIALGRLVAAGTLQEVLRTGILTRWYQVDLGVVHHPEVALPQVYLRQ